MSRTTNGKVKSDATHGLRSPMTPKTESKMSWIKSTALPRPIPPRPQLTSQQSSSLPSTPYQHPRDLPFRPGSPNEQDLLSSSPRSTHSESNHPLPSLRKPASGCKFETGLAFAKRRFPYALGTEKLEPKKPPKDHLDQDQKNALTADMTELYNKLLPTEDSERRRAQLVEKLENLFNGRWPGHTIKVNVFGSTGNKLGTSESDVDICITTDFKDLEHVCLLAEALAESGMERVVCVSSAKVPIVKIWDPVLQLACDMNVNNPVALENTQMIKTYVEIDSRVQPLALIIKHWTRRRLLNDAALGATLSSYTWICMIVNFLQTREPPILPALQRYPDLPQKTMEGLNVSYMKDLKQIQGFGDKNKDALGELLYGFFRYYGYELDYDAAIVSVREGKVTDKKTQPSWQINRLCVEEPFNFSRNLANTADDTSFRGIHFELRRACQQLCNHNLGECCIQYEHPPEEPRSFPIRHPIQHSRPVSTLPPSQTFKAHAGRGPNGAARGGRYATFQNRAPQNIGRRASSASHKGQGFSRQSLGTPTMTQHDASLQHQQQQQMLHDHLYHQFQLLQAQEQELRMQLRHQAAQQPAAPPNMLYPQIPFPGVFPVSEPGSEGSGRARAGTINQPPLTAPLHQNGFNYPSPYIPAYVPASHGASTNPPSPLLNSVVPDLRRNPRRSSITNGSSGGSLRAQSQPPRTAAASLSMHEGMPQQWILGDMVNPPIAMRNRALPSPNTLTRELDSQGYPFPRTPLATMDYGPRVQPSEYVGYYLGPLASSSVHSGAPYPPFSTQSSNSRRGTQPPPGAPYGFVTQSSPTSPTSSSRAIFSREAPKSTPSDRPSSPFNRPQTALRVVGAPLIVDGSKGHPNSHRSTVVDESNVEGEPLSYSTSTSDEIAINTPSSSDGSMNGRSELASTGSDLTATRFSNASEDENRAPFGKLKGLGVRQVFQDANSSKGQVSTSLFPQGDQNGHENSPHRVVTAESLSNGVVNATEHRGRLKKNLALREPLKHDQLSSPLNPDRTPTPSMNGRGTLVNGSLPSSVYEETHDQRNFDEAAALESARKMRLPPASPLTINGNKMTFSGNQAVSGHPASGHGWQTQTKRKNETGVKPAKEGIQVNALGGHNLPADASLRKGG